GIELAAQAANKIVIACGARYDEALSITQGVRLYSGFACPDSDTPFGEDAEARAEVAPSAAVPALEIRNVTEAVLIENVIFRAASATESGASSIAAIVAGADNVTLRGVRLEAGDGAKGRAGDNGIEGADGPEVTNLQGGLPASCTAAS